MFTTSLHLRNGPIRFGIVARLATIFLCVAGLVLASRLIVERSVLVLRTTHTTITVPTTASLAAPATPPPLAPDSAETLLIRADELQLALNRFEIAVQGRMQNNSPTAEAAFKRSSAELDRVAKEYRNATASLSDTLREADATAFATHQHLGQSLVRLADDRNAMLRQYAALLDGQKRRVQASLDKAWRIFGRVITRQSLLQLSADLDQLLRTSAGLNGMDEPETPAMVALLTAEARVQTDLDRDKDALIRSAGSAWYADMLDDFGSLVRLRKALAQINQESTGQSRQFSRQAEDLMTRLTDRRHARAARPATPAAVFKGASATDTKGVESSLGPSLAVVPPPVVETGEVRSPLAQSRATQDHFLWLSAAVVALLTYVAIGTAISIIRPVRRLVYASARLAKGDVAIRIPRGGLKELDSVAVAFNQMAEELSIARQNSLNYQKGLEQKVEERTRQLEDLAKHDPLTGLPNRREIFRFLDQALVGAELQRERVAVFFLDIDNFKYINDSLGHAYGDQVLVALAQRLLATTREIGFCARLGGDEFTVVFERAPDVDAIREAGMRIVKAFQQPLTIDKRDLMVSVSVGASIYPEHERHSEGLLKAADAALFRAKALGRSQLSVFTADLLEAANVKFRVEQGLRRGLERGEFELMYQPQIQVATLKTTVVEALLRWRAPDGRLVAPGEFLAVAEETGLIMEIGDWVLQSAIETAARWHHGDWPEVCVAINVSPRQLIDVGFVDRVLALLLQHGLPAHCIEIELTESVIQTGPATSGALHRLRSLGVAIALDDFGTGYSSISSLEQLPLTRIKLDRSLVAEIDRSSRAAAIANAIIGMCQGLGLEITAEGIERPEQFAMLVTHQGMHLQGYLLGRPSACNELIPSLEIVAQRAHKLVLESPSKSVQESDLVDMYRLAART